MTRTRLLSTVIGASLLLGFVPMAEATPTAAPPSAVEISAFSGNVTKALLGSERRQERRELRREHRHERRALRRLHRAERWAMRRGHREERRELRRGPTQPTPAQGAQ